MPRIRSVKPEFWDSPSTARASLRARLFYIAMWNWADDWGVGDANPRRLLGFAFPNDESSDAEPRNFRRIATEVAECYGVTWYEVDGRPYYAIPSWEDHQRTEKKARRAFPAPDQAERLLYEPVSEVPTPSSGNRHEGAGEQGSRGAGEVGTGEVPIASAIGAQRATNDSPESTQTIVAEWIDHCADRPPGRVIGQVSKEVKQMLTEGIPYEHIRRGVAAWHERSLHPSTLASVVHELRNPATATRSNGRPTTDDRVRGALALAQQLRDEEQQTFPQIGA